eukprot:652083-Pelagomonas_calceolata.AAC.4
MAHPTVKGCLQEEKLPYDTADLLALCLNNRRCLSTSHLTPALKPIQQPLVHHLNCAHTAGLLT